MLLILGFDANKVITSLKTIHKITHFRMIIEHCVLLPQKYRIGVIRA